MSRILLLANLNCDHVLSLAEPLVAGARLQYVDQGRRLGGGAANTGIGLVWAGHEVIIASRIGLDETGDWLLEQATGHGLDCSHVERFGGETGELLVVYQCLYPPYGLYTRSLEMFEEDVDVDREDNVTGQSKRFVLFDGKMNIKKK